MTARWADLTRDDLVRLLRGVSAHSKRVGLNQDLFTRGEYFAGTDALRWKSPQMPLAYNRNLAAEHGAAGRLMTKLGQGALCTRGLSSTSITVAYLIQLGINGSPS